MTRIARTFAGLAQQTYGPKQAIRPPGPTVTCPVIGVMTRAARRLPERRIEISLRTAQRPAPRSGGVRAGTREWLGCDHCLLAALAHSWAPAYSPSTVPHTRRRSQPLCDTRDRWCT